MKKEKDIFRLADLIARSLTETLSIEEQKELDAWLAISPANREKYEGFRAIGALRKKSEEYLQVDWQGDCKMYIASRARLQRRRKIQRFSQYAAVFVLLFGVAFGLYIRIGHEKGESPVAQSGVPVSKSAILSLAGGEQIVLSDSNFSALKMQGNTRVTVEGKNISYTNGREAKRERKMLFNTLRIPRGGEYFLTLSDGSTVWLNAETEIRYPVEFVGDNRIVYVEGEAYFDVKKDESRPFVVRSGQTDVKVMGTSFNFRSYSDEAGVTTTLESGSVIMISQKSKQEIRLEPGEQGTLDKKSGRLSKHIVNTYLYSAWKDGRLVFEDTRLEDLFHVLARWYDLQVFYVHPGAKDIRFTGDLNKSEDFGAILKIIENNERVEFEVNERTVSIRLR
ncbi:FecR family protein [Butyricimonas paravirosa]